MVAELDVAKFYQGLPGFHVLLFSILSGVPIADYGVVAACTLRYFHCAVRFFVLDKRFVELL